MTTDHNLARDLVNCERYGDPLRRGVLPAFRGKVNALADAEAALKDKGDLLDGLNRKLTDAQTALASAESSDIANSANSAETESN